MRQFDLPGDDVDRGRRSRLAIAVTWAWIAVPVVMLVGCGVANAYSNDKHDDGVSSLTAFIWLVIAVTATLLVALVLTVTNYSQQQALKQFQQTSVPPGESLEQQ